MQIIKINAQDDYSILAPRVLVGPELIPAKKLNITIKRGRIASLRSFSDRSWPDTAGKSRVFQLEDDSTLMPALIDAHVHLALDGDDFNRALARWDQPDALESRIRCSLKKILQSGIGLIRDGGDCRAINLRFRDLANNDEYTSPRIVAVGEALRRKNGYGAFLGRGFCSPEEIPRLIDRFRLLGIDQLKVILSGVVDFSSYDRVNGDIFSREEMALVMVHARKYGLKVMAHASSDAAVDLAVQAGVDSVEHGYYVRRETLARMADQQIAWIPTVIPVAVQAREPYCHKRGHNETAIIARIIEEQIEKIAFAIKCGVPVGVGTDSGAAGVKHGSNLVEELLLYSRGALSNRAVLKSVTAVNARILGLEKDYGSIAVGLRPQLIAVHGNPLRDLNALKNIGLHFMPDVL